MISSTSLRVYGHVVASDVLGDIYVIPMISILQQITACVPESSIRLPQQHDPEVGHTKSSNIRHDGAPESSSQGASQSSGEALRNIAARSTQNEEVSAPGVLHSALSQTHRRGAFQSYDEGYDSARTSAMPSTISDDSACSVSSMLDDSFCPIDTMPYDERSIGHVS